MGCGGSPRRPVAPSEVCLGRVVRPWEVVRWAPVLMLGQVKLRAVAGRPVVPSAVLLLGRVQRWVGVRWVLVLLLGLVVLPSAVRLVGLVHRSMATRCVVGRVTVRHVAVVVLQAEVRRRTVGVPLILWHALEHAGCFVCR